MALRRTSGRLFWLALFLAAGIALLFLLLPLVAVFARVPPGRLIGQLGDRVVLDAFVVSLKANAIAELLILAVGTPTAYLLASRRFRGRSVALTLIELPLVLPPAVAGIGLFAAFGRLGLLGSTLHAVGIEIPYTQAAVVMAIAFVASPFYLRQAVAAFEAVDRNLLDASRTLGASPARTFARVALPLAAGGLGAGAALALARGIGEFGATIMFAGNLQGLTQTLPLAIYAEFNRSFDVALTIGAVLVSVSATLLLALKAWPLWLRSGSTSLFPSARSGSS
jgi:molybdate transport system permease protein